jgi:outer membrane protein assembly factor BamD (BamD/ComL family)
MKTTKIASTVILLFVPVLLLACATAKSQYEDARKANTISAYQEFLSKYPSGEYAKLAQTRIETLNFEKAQAVNSVDAYENFMLSSNSDLFKNYAIQRIKKIHGDEYLKAKEIDSVEAYDHYMTNYPKSDFLSNCVERIEYLEWSRALKRHDAVGYYKYLNNCSACGKHNQEAQKRFKDAVRTGEVVDLSLVKNKVEQILNRSDIVVVQSKSNKISTKIGSKRIEDLSSADEVLVGPKKGEKTIGAADLAKGNDASVKTLRLKNRVPMSSDNTIGFSTIIFYSQKNGETEILFIEDGRGYLFQETESDIY